MSEQQAVDVHYARRGDLSQRLIDLVTAAGAPAGRLSWEDLKPLDQFHLRGHMASEELIELLAPEPGQRLLDIGCGLGGPARMAAAKRACHVTGIDLTATYIDAAEKLSACVGMSEKTAFLVGDATSMAFPDAHFDAALSQHVSMNIADKARLYGEALRVLRPGGRFALYDIVGGPNKPIHFPVPWASHPQWSHLLPPEELRAAVNAAGFEELVWEDLKEIASQWSRELRDKTARGEIQGPVPADLLGHEFLEMLANVHRNLDEQRIGLVRGLFRRPQ